MSTSFLAMAARTPKEKVLHTRVPEALEAQIKALADALRVPVSSLVRNILEDSVAAIDSATAGIDETLENVTKNVRRLQERAKVDQGELRRGWTEFQTILAESFASRGASRASVPAEPRSFADVVGWQSLTMNIAAECARCARAIAPGETGHLGVRDQPGARVIICGECLPRKEGKI